MSNTIKKQFIILNVQDQLQSSTNIRLEKNLQRLRNQYINQLKIQKTMDIFDSETSTSFNGKNVHEKEKKIKNQKYKITCTVL
jgi:hypothetical protein